MTFRSARGYGLASIGARARANTDHVGENQCVEGIDNVVARGISRPAPRALRVRGRQRGGGYVDLALGNSPVSAGATETTRLRRGILRVGIVLARVAPLEHDFDVTKMEPNGGTRGPLTAIPATLLAVIRSCGRCYSRC
jgi:hypothetical protein